MDRGTAILLALILAPGPLVLLVALLRGYSIQVLFQRDRERDR